MAGHHCISRSGSRAISIAALGNCAYVLASGSTAIVCLHRRTPLRLRNGGQDVCATAKSPLPKAWRRQDPPADVDNDYARNVILAPFNMGTRGEQCRTTRPQVRGGPRQEHQIAAAATQPQATLSTAIPPPIAADEISGKRLLPHMIALMAASTTPGPTHGPGFGWFGLGPTSRRVGRVRPRSKKAVQHPTLIPVPHCTANRRTRFAHLDVIKHSRRRIVVQEENGRRAL